MSLAKGLSILFIFLKDQLLGLLISIATLTFSYIYEVKWSESHSVMSDSLWPHYTVHGILQARILEWVAFPFSRGFSWPRNWTQISCIAGRFFINWTMREVQTHTYIYIHTHIHTYKHMCFPRGSDGKESACNAGDLGSIPGSGISPGEGMATRSSILAWRIPWTKEPGGLESTGLQRVRQNWMTNTFIFSSFLISVIVF